MSRAILLILVVAPPLGACGVAGLGAEDAGPSSAEQWQEAQRQWERRTIDAYDTWAAIDPSTAEGQQAHRRLREADAHYRTGVQRLVDGRADALRSLQAGVRIGPMDPDHYLELARACRDHELNDRAKEYYRKYLAARPYATEASAARAELLELPRDVFDPPVPAEPPPPAAPTEAAGSLAVPIAAGAGALLTLTLGLLFVAWRRRGESLASLANSNPELHPAIAYLVGSLRHELLKHRVGAVGDAVAALERGNATAEQLSFLRARLYGGEPLPRAWEGHLRSFERALGYRLDLRRDRGFRRAGREVRRIQSLESGVASRSRAVVRALSAAHARLRAFDRDLSQLVAQLVRTRVDQALLSDVVTQVRGEYAPSLVELDELDVRGPEEQIEVEVFRVDLEIILKNIVRNAILAVGRGGPPRRVGLDVRVDLEPTGEEIVRLRVRDTSEESLSTQAIYDRRVDRGLGLVTAALTRYDGAIEVEPGTEGYAKGVCIRFFRALADEDEEGGEP